MACEIYLRQYVNNLGLQSWNPVHFFPLTFKTELKTQIYAFELYNKL